MKAFLLGAALFLFQLTNLRAQNNLQIGQWDDLLSYRTCLGLAASDNKIYCASQATLFSVDKSDHSLQEYTRIGGLSDIATTMVAFNSVRQQLIIVYANSNIDVMQNGKIINISDLQQKNIVGDKRIYGIYVQDPYAYFSCGFGIMVLDLNNLEIKDTYYIGPNGTNIQVNNVCADDSFLYAATINGVMRASINDPFLANYTHWQLFTTGSGLTGGAVNDSAQDIINFQNTIYAAKGDSIFQFSQNHWYLYWTESGSIVKRLRAGSTKIVVSIHGAATKVITLQNGQVVDNIPSAFPYDAIEDNGSLWIADLYNGLFQFHNDSVNYIYPNGPYSNSIFDMTVNGSNHNLYVVPGAWTASFTYSYNIDGFFCRLNDEWKNDNLHVDPKLNNIFDFVCAAINPANHHVMLGTYWYGIFEWDDSLGLINHFVDSNSSLGQVIGDPGRIRIAGLNYDRFGNLWVSNLGADSAICVQKPDGKWLKFKPPVSIPQNWISRIAFDQYDQTWFVMPRTGLLVMNYGSSLDDPTDDKYTQVVNSIGHGNLPDYNTNCVAVDQDGNVWVGMLSGVAVIYCPGDVISSQGCDAQQIVVVAADGIAGYLLSNENVHQILIDGANRKWFATDDGLWLYSPDGTQQIEHYTTENSPLFSNVINALTMDYSTGDLYVGTDKGLMVLRSDATLGSNTSCSPLVYPNPIRQGYTGPIIIKNVVNDADVKITDISGKLIYRTQALGGQIVWNGTDYHGNAAKDGVYLVFASNADGSISCSTKLLLMR